MRTWQDLKFEEIMKILMDNMKININAVSKKEIKEGFDKFRQDPEDPLVEFTNDNLAFTLVIFRPFDSLEELWGEKIPGFDLNLIIKMRNHFICEPDEMI